MTDSTPSEEHGELAVGWLLHTLDPEQELRFLAHLEGCDECRRAVGEASTTIESVGRALPQYDPPPGLRDRILAAAAEEEAGSDGGSSRRGATASAATVNVPNDAVATSGTFSGLDVDADADADADGEPAPVVALSSRRRRWVTRGLAAAAAAVVIAAVGGLAAANQSLRQDRDAATASAASADGAQRVVRMLDAASAPGVRHATLATSSGALVGLVADDGRGPQVLATGLAGNRSDQTYVLWGMEDGHPVGLGAFDLSGSGSAVRSVRSEQQAAPFTGYAVSLEPGHTVPAVPTEIVASGQVGR